MDIKWIGCHANNFRTSPTPRGIIAIVIHVMDGTLAGTDEWFKNKEAKVSAHYGVGKSGQIHQYVDEKNIAFHAGRVLGTTWGTAMANLNANPNTYTIGIEHEGKASDEWPDEMYRASAELIADICKRHSLPIDRDHICGHREIYVAKTCPGKCDLDKLISMARLLSNPQSSDPGQSPAVS